ASSRWLECPGSVQLAERMPDDDVSLPSATGTAAHQLAEECLKTGRYPARYKGKRYHVDGFDIEVDDAMVYGVTLYVKYCNLLHSPGDMRWIELDVTKWMTTLHPWFGG
ncbi:MAG: DUF2800 domain-containing protein, partial [Anaerolineae bacterium]|nr:DUF2800 domain-containing protein [Anaerolineae bacterium]